MDLFSHTGWIVVGWGQMVGSTAGATANKICTRPYVDRDGHDGDVDDDDGRWTVEVHDSVSFERDWGFFRVYSLARLLSASMR